MSQTVIGPAAAGQFKGQKSQGSGGRITGGPVSVTPAAVGILAALQPGEPLVKLVSEDVSIPQGQGENTECGGKGARSNPPWPIAGLSLIGQEFSGGRFKAGAGPDPQAGGQLAGVEAIFPSAGRSSLERSGGISLRLFHFSMVPMISGAHDFQEELSNLA